MAEFPQTVAVPSTASYATPLVDFSQIANAPNTYYQGKFNKQQEQLNAAKIQQINQQVELSKAFAGGLPTDPATGQIDYRKAAAILASKGDIGSAVSLLQQQPAPLSPMFGGGGQPAGQPQGQPQPQPQAQPTSLPARPLPPTPAGATVGDAGTGTVTSMVTDRLPSQNMTTGQTILKIAQTMGVDPNANLTPGQQRRAQGLLERYAPEIAGTNGGPGGAKLPPSANAVSSAPQVAQAAPIGAGGQGVPAMPRPQQGASGQPQAQPQQAAGPITPQVPLPQGFTDPAQAIQALRTEAVKYANMPGGRGVNQARELDNWATRIEQSIAPVEMTPGKMIVDPRSAKVLFQAPATNMKDVALRRFLDEHPDATAEEIQKFNAQGRPARSAAAMSLQRFLEEHPGATSEDIQNFNAAQIGKSAAERVRANREENLNLILRATEAAIPAALEASKALPRTQYVPLNKLIQKGEIMSSDPRLVEFGMSNLQLAEHWARAMNPTGVMRESDRDKALTFLDTAYANSTYERGVRQLEKQIKREQAAVRGGKPTKDIPAPGELSAEQKAAATDEGKGTTIKWERGPDGNPRPVQ